MHLMRNVHAELTHPISMLSLVQTHTLYVGLQRLFVRNLSDTYMCPSCGDVPETPEHYFVFCHEYDTCLSNLVENIPIEAWNLDCILYGSARYTVSLNYLIQIEA